MDRLRAAVVKAKRGAENSAKGPELPPPTSDAVRRQAVEAMRRQVTAPAMEVRARQALAAGEAKMATEREAMARRLREALGLDAPDMAAVAKAVSRPANTNWVPVLFVSSSMPVSTLRTYAAQLERVGGVLAFRGMPGGLHRVGPMAKLSAEILRLDPGCEGPACAMRNVQLIIDPIVFRQHGIARVPALGMIPGDPTQPYCERDDESPTANHIVYGDAALSGLLDEYARLGGKEEVRDAQAHLAGR
jgi:type-F conjugative transfer system pilin assembly protein TrbC